MPATVQLLDFQPSQYSCPVQLVEGGGEGRYGICAMELVSILTGEAETHGRPYDTPESVSRFIRYAFQATNDVKRDISGERRADDLWPLLRYAFGTTALNDILGGGLSGEVFKSNFVHHMKEVLGLTTVCSCEGFSCIMRKYALDDDWGIDWGKAIHALKVALTYYWGRAQELANELGKDIPQPQADYTPEQIERLNSWINEVRQDELMNDLPKILREAE